MPPIDLTEGTNPSQEIDKNLKAVGEVRKRTIDKDQVFAILTERQEGLLERRTRELGIEFLGSTSCVAEKPSLFF